MERDSASGQSPKVLGSRREDLPRAPRIPSRTLRIPSGTRGAKLERSFCSPGCFRRRCATRAEVFVGASWGYDARAGEGFALRETPLWKRLSQSDMPMWRLLCDLWGDDPSCDCITRSPFLGARAERLAEYC